MKPMKLFLGVSLCLCRTAGRTLPLSKRGPDSRFGRWFPHPLRRKGVLIYVAADRIGALYAKFKDLGVQEGRPDPDLGGHVILKGCKVKSVPI